MNIKRGHIIVAIILILALVVVSLLMNRARTGVLEISAPKTTPENAAVAVEISRNGQEEEVFTLKPGEKRELRLRSGTIRVDGWVGSLRSVDIVKIEGFATTKLQTPTGEQRIAQQLASDAKYCPVIVNDVVYSYGCEGEGPVLKHTSNKLGSSLNSVLFDGTSFSNMQPYKEGLLGFYASAGNAANLVYVNLATQSTEIVKLPSKVEAYMTDQPQITVAKEQGNTRFALMFSQKSKLYVFDDAGDTTPTDVKLSNDVRLNQEGRISAASFYDDTFVVYTGFSSDLGEGVSEEGSAADPAPTLDQYLFEFNKDGKQTKVFKISDDLEANNIYKISDEFYAADQPYGFGFFHAQGDELQHVYTIDEMGSWTIANKKAYVQAEGIMYEFKPGKGGLFSLDSVFSSNSITVSALFTGPRGVLFTGLADAGEDAPVNVYQLLDEIDPSGGGQGNVQTNRGEPTYSGLDDLLFYGVTSFNVANTRYALGTYAANSAAVPVTSIELTGVEPEPYDRFSDNTTTIIHFQAALNGGSTILNGKLEIFDLKTIRLFLLDKDSNATVFDSGTINNQESPIYNPESEH